MTLLRSEGSGEVSTGFYNGVATQSARFDANHYMTQSAPSSAGDRRQFTFSWWAKKAVATEYATLYSNLLSGSNSNSTFFLIYLDGSASTVVAGGIDYAVVSTAKLRDLTNWYHCVLVVDTDQASNANRMKIYINGILGSSMSGTCPQIDLPVNNTQAYQIGRRMVNNDRYMDALIADFNLVDGTAIGDTSRTNPNTGETEYVIDEFGEFKNGVWIPKAYTGSYGTNGFRLEFKEDGTSANSSGIGADTSSNNHHFTPVNMVGGDSNISDSPENNFATFNPLTLVNNGSVSEANLKYTSSSSWGGSQSTFAIPSSGKWYVEFRIGSNTSNTAQLHFGIQKSGVLNSYTTTGYYGFEINNGFFTYVNGTFSGYTSGKSAGDILQMAIDADNGKIYYGHNNTYYVNYNTTGGDPSGGNNPSASSLDFGATDFVIIVRSDRNNGVINFGQDGTFAGTETAQDNADANGIGNFYYAPPTNFLALCSANLPDPTIGPQTSTQADNHFDTLIWTGDGSSPRNIGGLNFKPDWIWDKARDGGTGLSHVLYDSSRGVKQIISTDQTSLESTLATGTSAFRDDGFTVNAFSNASGQGRVAWCWKANGGTTTTNDASSTGVGTIDSVFQANNTSGFSIVLYTGTGSAGTVKHGLSVAPSLVIIKSRTTASPSNWVIGQDQSGFTGQNYFTNIGAFSTNSGSFNNTAPTSSVVSIGTDQTTNGNTATYVMYCFANVEGFSKIGSYEMNYNSDGPFVYTGFRPAWLLTRPVDQNGNWSIYDNVRDLYNDGDANMVFAGSNGVESGFAASAVDFVSNGFKIRHSSDGYSNIASNTAIYMAFAEQPFKFSNAR